MVWLVAGWFNWWIGLLFGWLVFGLVGGLVCCLVGWWLNGWRIGHGAEQTKIWIKRGILDLILAFFNNMRELLISLEILNVSLPH